MKVALISEWVDPWRGGAETSTLQFLHHLLDHGVEVHLFTRSRPAAAPRLHVHHIGGASMSRTRRSVTFAHRIEPILRSGDFDVRHAITPCRFVDIYQPRGGTVAESIERNLALRKSRGGRAWKRLGNRFNLKQRYQLHLEQTLMLDPSGPVIVAISDYVVRQLRRHYRLDEGRIRKIYNGVDKRERSESKRLEIRNSVREEFGIGDAEVLALSVAHNFRLKGVGRLLEAMSMLLQRGVGDIRALVVGKDDAPAWSRRARRLGVASQVRFVGPSNRVDHLYAAADLLVHPSYYDPCSRVVLEAMVAGLACITSEWDGASEMIVDGQNGFVLSDPSDVTGLADLMQKLRDAQFRRKLGGQASRIIDDVSMARHASAMIEVYRDIATTRPPAVRPALTPS